MTPLLLVLILIGLLVAFYLYRDHCFKRWTSKGIPLGSGGSGLLGHYKDIILGRRHMEKIFSELYDEYPDSPFTIYSRMGTPCILVKDPEVIKAILTTDFKSFNKNEMVVNKETDCLLGNNPALLYGQEWKAARAHMSPSVSLAKLKTYFEQFVKVADKMVEYVAKNMNERGTVEMNSKELAELFTTDVVANSVYGVAVSCFDDRDTIFYKLTREVFAGTFTDYVNTMMAFLFPGLSHLFGFRFSSKKAEKVLVGMARDVIRQRLDAGDYRNDFFGQVIAYRNSGKEHIFTDKYVASHLYEFILDAYETSSIVISYTMFELAWHSEVQDKLRDEINEITQRCGSNLGVVDIENAKYLDMVVCESLRLHVPFTAMFKECTADYKITKCTGLVHPFTIEKGTRIAIPTNSLQLDPKYYPEPDRFDPERFTEEERAKRHKFVFIPFSEGPRKCVGQRFGLLQIKLALWKIVQNFRLSPSSKSNYKLELEQSVFMMQRADNGPWVNIHKLNDQ